MRYMEAVILNKRTRRQLGISLKIRLILNYRGYELLEECILQLQYT